MTQSLNEIRSLAGLSVNADSDTALLNEAKISFAGKHMLVLLQDHSDLAASGPAELVAAWLIKEVKRGVDREDKVAVEAWAAAFASGDLAKAENLYEGWGFGIGEIVVAPMSKVATVVN